METILLVDDEPNLRAMIGEVLAMDGYEVLEAGDGVEACRVEAATPGPIHLLLTDVMMPGLSGPDLARRLRPRRPRMKTIYMSAFTMVDFNQKQIHLDPGVPILAKPFTLDALGRKVRDVLGTNPVSSSPFATARR